MACKYTNNVQYECQEWKTFWILPFDILCMRVYAEVIFCLFMKSYCLWLKLSTQHSLLPLVFTAVLVVMIIPYLEFHFRWRGLLIGIAQTDRPVFFEFH